MIRTNIRIGKYSNIFEYPNIRHTMVYNRYKKQTFFFIPDELPNFYEYKTR